ncbi:MAG: PleD family two-component system response regulator [Akkermansiaceae bacterium]
MNSTQKNEPSPRISRILVVDDEVSFTRLLKLNLEATGRYEVLTENNPLVALPAAIYFKPDIVLMDVMMPGLDGGDVASRFGEHPELMDIPIIFLTATVRHSEVDERHGEIGGLHFLSKPVSMPELLGCLDEHFSGRRDLHHA